NKVYLKFPQIFWDEKFEQIAYMGERVGEWCDWLNFAPYIGEPVLMAFHGGAKGYAIEELSDDEIIAGAMKTLRVMYGDSIPEPEGYVITRWGNDPFAFGSYSHVPPFASGEDYDALFEPVDDVLFFAGEAASREYPATVHGAYLSGVAAADEIALKLTEFHKVAICVKSRYSNSISISAPSSQSPIFSNSISPNNSF
ncbi:MAG: FAD-dependent oxidoreductase, partial [Chloroflexi bacterium]|nr:FAD-dependent oxidoreductase [Chloroflexota bacterium]